jgi:hypothetical protein
MNANGQQLKAWKIVQPAYDIADIPSGIYILTIELNNGDQQILKLNKQ